MIYNNNISDKIVYFIWLTYAKYANTQKMMSTMNKKAHLAPEFWFSLTPAFSLYVMFFHED